MSIARHHAEWLSLVEASGPFLSMPVLLRVFPQGLDARDPERARALRLAYAEWSANGEARRPDPALHRAWTRFIFREVLEYPDEILREGQDIPAGLEARVAEHGETIRPDLIVVNPEGRDGAGRPRLLVHTLRVGQSIDGPLEGHRWKASPATRMMMLLQACGVRLGLVTNGEQWTLVHAPPRETTTFASWYATIWTEEPLALRSFHTLLGAHRLFGASDAETLEAILTDSSQDQQEVTDQLGFQVRKAVEVLVQAFDRIDRDRGRALLAGIPEATLYEAALAVMMRLVFLFSAEERGLLLLGDPLYDQNYSVSTLRAWLREAADQHGEEVLERRHDAWARLLATFRAVYGGVEHDAMRLLAYGGALFDPDRYPFLEGRARATSWKETAAQPLPVNNRTVLHLLESLQILRVKMPGGGAAEARRLSFRALDIEQIGHVYEGLLDHTAKRALSPDVPVLGLAGTKDREPEVSLPTLEHLKDKGEDDLVSFIKEETGKSEKAVRKAVTYAPTLEQSGKLQAVCLHDPGLYGRVRSWAGLIREDTEGWPVVIGEGSVYVTRGSDRRSTGTHYTPRSLTEPIVQHTLDPLVYDGPAEGKPREEWRLKAARDVLRLRVCDVAMGSGAFLVQACRYLSERLVEAWEEAERADPGRVVITPEGDLSTGSASERPIPRDVEERLAIARRVVADRCLYGVDVNPMAVEMAKLSLWLVTLQKDRPFSFLDHSLRCGDSLLGLTAREQIEWMHLDPARGREIHDRLFDYVSVCAPAFRTAIDKRRKLESFQVDDIRDAEEKRRLLQEADKAIAGIRVVGDLVIGAALTTAEEAPGVFDARVKSLASKAAETLDPTTPPDVRRDRLSALREEARALLAHPRGGQLRRPFHWVVEFPEVFLEDGDGARGFDAVVGNPPFLGGQRITGILGTDYRNHLVEHVARGKRGSADLCSYFFLRATNVLRNGGSFGLLATNTIAQGDTREVGLEQIVEQGCVIPRAVPSRKWPGAANLEVAHVWVRRGTWEGAYLLDDIDVPGITPYLTRPASVEGKPHRLVANETSSFIGSYVLGLGFVLTPEDAQELIARDPRNKDVLFPYLNGEDLNSRPDQSASRWVINFHDWPLNREAPGKWEGSRKEERQGWLRAGVVPRDYPEPVASDYPDCLSIAESRVKPERTRKRADGSSALRYPLYLKWWIYAEKRPALYSIIGGLERVLVTAQTSRTQVPCWVPGGQVYAHKLVVFTVTNDSELALLTSNFHYHWIATFGSTLRTDAVYTPSDCFETFPFPRDLSGIESIGSRLDRERRRVMVERGEGLTKIYNRIHDPSDRVSDIDTLRTLHTELDYAVANTYEWTDLNLDHGFHQTKQGVRFTISETARREVLARLLRLNHEQHAAELGSGKRQSKKRRADANGGGGRKKGLTVAGARLPFETQ